MTVSPFVESKAARLLVAGAVAIRRHDEEQTGAEVAGDHDEYVVRWDRATGWLCPCPAHGPCSHLRAVRRVLGGRPS